jgi:4-amino-4-deoxy-L-arabinose transferase-like glycosyltransferase
MNFSNLARHPSLVTFEGWINRWFDAADGSKAILIFLCLFVMVWTSFQIISYASIDLHQDLVEAFSWSQHLAPGYKHPPLTAMIVAAWFSLFPAADWAFHLLSMVNAAIAFFAIDLIARRWIDGDKRLLVPVLLLLTPFYQFHGQRFGANQVLLSIWPIATYCFLRSFEERTVLWSVAAGVTAALAMLGKYYSVVLIVAFLTSVLIDPRRLAYLKSPAPWLAVAAGLLVLTPHLHWLMESGGQTFAYAYLTHAAADIGHLLWKLASYWIGAIAYVALPIVVWIFLVRPDQRIMAATFWPSDPGRRMLVTLQAGLVLNPLLISPLTGIELTSLWTMSAWFLLPIVFLAPVEAAVRRHDAVRVAAVVSIISLAVLTVSPAVAWIRFAREKAIPDRAHYGAVSDELTRLWRQETHERLRIVAGEFGIAHAVTFYSKDHPELWSPGNSGSTPWIDDQRRQREGWVGVCAMTSQYCIERISRAVDNVPFIRAEYEHSASFFGHIGPTLRFVFFIVPPLQFDESALSRAPHRSMASPRLLHLGRIGIGEEQLLAVDTVGADGVLALGREDPVDEGLAQLLFHARMPGRVHKNDTVLIEHELVACHGDLQRVLVPE